MWKPFFSNPFRISGQYVCTNVYIYVICIVRQAEGLCSRTLSGPEVRQYVLRVQVYLCMHTCIYIYVYTFTQCAKLMGLVPALFPASVCIYIFTHIYMYIDIYKCKYIYTYICIYIYIYILISIYL